MKLKTYLWSSLTLLFLNCTTSDKDNLVGDFDSMPPEFLSSTDKRTAETRISLVNDNYFLQSIKKDGTWNDKKELKPVSREKINELFSAEREKNVLFGLFLKYMNTEIYYFKVNKDESDELFKTGYLSCIYKISSRGEPFSSRSELYKVD